MVVGIEDPEPYNLVLQVHGEVEVLREVRRRVDPQDRRVGAGGGVRARDVDRVRYGEKVTVRGRRTLGLEPHGERRERPVRHHLHPPVVLELARTTARARPVQVEVVELDRRRAAGGAVRRPGSDFQIVRARCRKPARRHGDCPARDPRWIGRRRVGELRECRGDARVSVGWVDEDVNGHRGCAKKRDLAVKVHRSGVRGGTAHREALVPKPAHGLAREEVCLDEHEAPRVPAGGLVGAARRPPVLPVGVGPWRGRRVQARVRGVARLGGLCLQSLLNAFPLVVARDRAEEVVRGRRCITGDCPLRLHEPSVRDGARAERAEAIEVQVVRDGAADAGHRDVLVAIAVEVSDRDTPDRRSPG